MRVEKRASAFANAIVAAYIGVTALAVSACGENGLRLGWFADPEPTPTPAAATASSTPQTRTPAGTDTDPADPTDPDFEPTPAPTPPRVQPTPGPGSTPIPDDASTPGPRPTTRPTPQPTTTPDSDPEEERVSRLYDLIDEYRARYGLAPLKIHPALNGAAQDHAEDLAKRGETSPLSSDDSGPGDRLRDAGYNWANWGENLAGGYDSPEEVFKAWIESLPHRANLLHKDFTDIGIGHFESYWVQEFASPQEQKTNRRSLTNFR